MCPIMIGDDCKVAKIYVKVELRGNVRYCDSVWVLLSLNMHSFGYETCHVESLTIMN